MPASAEQGALNKVPRTSNAFSKSKTEASEAPAVHRKAQIAASSEPLASPVPDIVESAITDVSREEIAKLAHSFWVERNYRPGSPEEDWLRAETQLLSARA